MKIFTIVLGILTAIAGVACLFIPGASMASLSWLLAMVMIVVGIGLIIDYFQYKDTGLVSGWDVVVAILALVLGVMILINQNVQFLTEVMIVYLFAGWLLIGGIMRIIEAFEWRKVALTGGWVWTLVFGIIGLLLGIYAFVHPTVAAMTIGWLMALIVFVIGINTISLGVMIPSRKQIKKIVGQK